jgi:hypothetical protein
MVVRSVTIFAKRLFDGDQGQPSLEAAFGHRNGSKVRDEFNGGGLICARERRNDPEIMPAPT